MWNRVQYQKTRFRRPVCRDVLYLQDVQAAIPAGWCSRCGGEVYQAGRALCSRCSPETAEWRAKQWRRQITAAVPALVAPE